MDKSSRRTFRAAPAVGVALTAALVAAGCGSSGSSGDASNANAGVAPKSPAAQQQAAPGTIFRVANVSGVGRVLVDGRGRTVYLLTADGKTSVPCTDSSGCTKIWPDLSLPDGVNSATAGSGVNASLLKTKKVGSENYATYNGWLLYEYVGDNSSGQANGQGIKSFGGTWYAVTAAGAPAKASSSNSNGNAPGYGGY